MSRDARPFIFELTAPEIEQLVGTPVSGEGGLQNLQIRLQDELAKGPFVSFTDAQLGQLIRYMTRYGGGGFEARLHRAFARSIYDLLATKLTF